MARVPKLVAASSRLIPRALHVFRERGVDVDALIRRLGLPPDAERAEEVALSPADFEILLSTASRELDDPLLAVHLPALLAWPSYNIGELAARASPTLREAFERVVRYASLFYAHLSFRCEDRGDEFVVACPLRSGGVGGRYGNEYAVASTLLYARRLSGVEVVPREVFFSHGAPPGIAALRLHFGTSDVKFERDENGLVFAAQDIARPSIGHDARLLATVEKLADNALKDSPSSPDFVATVAAKIRKGLSRGPVEARTIAGSMRLSTRTLQRRLEDCGTTFTALLERVRKSVMLDAVSDRSIPLAEAAQRAGFSDPSAFGRAFKRLTGQSPGEYRMKGSMNGS